MATAISKLSPEKMQKLARMELSGVPRKQTAMAMGVSESRISQLIATDEYQEQSEAIAQAKFQENELVNKGWDSVEAMGLKNVITALQNDPDPDFSLRASVVANKATRRGSQHQNNPIAQAAGAKAVIHLNTKFVQNLQQNSFNVVERKNELADKQKDTNFLGARGVQDLLQAEIVHEESTVEESSEAQTRSFGIDGRILDNSEASTSIAEPDDLLQGFKMGMRSMKEEMNIEFCPTQLKDPLTPSPT